MPGEPPAQVRVAHGLAGYRLLQHETELLDQHAPDDGIVAVEPERAAVPVERVAVAGVLVGAIEEAHLLDQLPADARVVRVEAACERGTVEQLLVDRVLDEHAHLGVARGDAGRAPVVVEERAHPTGGDDQRRRRRADGAAGGAPGAGERPARQGVGQEAAASERAHAWLVAYSTPSRAGNHYLPPETRPSARAAEGRGEWGTPVRRRGRGAEPLAQSSRVKPTFIVTCQ